MATVNPTGLHDSVTYSSGLVLFDSADDEALKPAKQVPRGDDDWDASVRSSGAVPRYNTTLANLFREIEALRDETKHDATGISQVEAEQVSNGLVRAFRARKGWKAARKQPARLPGKELQSWLVTFSNFLTSYSGIVEVVKGVDNNYGGIAYGTLSVLLAIPVRKNQHEADIEDALEEFGLAFPRLESLNGTYPERSIVLKRLIVEIYADVIHFSRECVTYYLKSSLGRVVQVASLKNNIKSRVTSIRKLLAQIRAECDVLMHRRIAELQQDSQELLAQMEALKKQIADQQNNKDDENISLLRSALKTDPQDTHLDLTAYRSLLNRSFADVETDSREKNNPRLLTWQRFASEPVVHQWLHHPGSSVVVLAGRNIEAVNNVTLSWLSYGSILAVEHFREAAPDTVTAYYLCQTSPVAVGRRRVTVQELGASLLYQIACQVPQALRSGVVEDLRQAAESASWMSDDDEEALEAIGGALLRLLCFIGSETTVVLVLDRLDQCQLDSTAGGAGTDDLKHLLAWIISIVARAGCVLKVIIVLRPRSEEQLLLQRQRVKQRESGSYFEKLDWHQDYGRLVP